MTNGERESARKRLMAIVEEVKTVCGYRKSQALEAIAQRFAESDDRLYALQIAADRLYEEKHRRRAHGLRAGYAVERNGQMYSLALLEQTPREARNTVGRELDHAHGSLERAEWDRYLLGVAEQRIRERGLNPDEIDQTLSDFIDADEASVLWQEWREDRAA